MPDKGNIRFSKGVHYTGQSEKAKRVKKEGGMVKSTMSESSGKWRENIQVKNVK